MSVAPHTIAVDLTPLLPGGENGGAKIFVLDLLRGVAEFSPATNFVLLTRASSHDELASLDRTNVRRVMVLGADVRAATRPLVRRIANRVLPILPNRLRQSISRRAYGVNAFLKRGTSRSLLRDLDVDLLFCPFTAPIYAEPDVATVCTIYDLQYKAFPDFFAPEDVALRAQTFSEACKHAVALAAISDYSRMAAIDEGTLDPVRIRTIHLRLATRVHRGATADCEVFARHALTSGRYAIYPANFWQHKNHEMLVTAFGMACASGLPSDIKLVCTGSPGDRRDWIESAVRRLGLAERIVFPGYVSDTELSALMAGAGAMIFPSLYEGFGLPVVEAMSAGVPVACSDGSSLPEVVAGAAILFDPRKPEAMAKAIALVIDDPIVRDGLRERGLRRAAYFSDRHRMIEEYWALFEHAMTVGPTGKASAGRRSSGRAS